ncbi:hypothetical protein PTKIN_Ptkin06aG0180900 [Pterospermum kingtungense]
MLQEDQAFCVFCNREKESVDHLFCHGAILWEVWTNWLNQWNFHGVVRALLKLAFCGFEELQVEGKQPGLRLLRMWKKQFEPNLIQIPAVNKSARIDVGSANMAEILDIREAFNVFAASQWVSSHELIIESESSNAVKWALNPGIAPWQVRHVILHIEVLKSKVPNWSIVQVLREGNAGTDKLAKDGVYRNEPFIKIYS